MLVPEFRELPVDQVKPATYNPPSRIRESAIRGLRVLMGQYGMPYPIMVNPEYRLIDGHRRLVCAKDIGWPTIPAIVLNGVPEEMYAALNAASRKMTGAEWLYVWLAEPNAVTGRHREQFQAMQSRIGRSLVRRIVERGLSTSIYRTACEVSRYCKDESDAFVVSVVKWLLEYPIVGRVREAMKAEISPRRLAKAIADNVPVELS